MSQQDSDAAWGRYASPVGKDGSNQATERSAYLAGFKAGEDALREQVGWFHDLASLTELARENCGRLVIQTGMDGGYRVELDCPNGCATERPSLGEALDAALKLSERAALYAPRGDQKG